MNVIVLERYIFGSGGHFTRCIHLVIHIAQDDTGAPNATAVSDNSGHGCEKLDMSDNVNYNYKIMEIFRL